MNGIEAAMQIRRACPETRVIFLTQDHDIDLRQKALEIGAAYILKTSLIRELLPAMQAVIGVPDKAKFRSSHRLPNP